MHETCSVYSGYKNDRTGEKTSPHEWQTKFHSSRAKFKLLVGAWSSGKTVSGYTEGFQHSCESPNNLGLVCRETYDELRDTTRKEWLDRTPRGLIKKFSLTKNELTLWCPARQGTVSTILFRSLIDAQHHRQARKFGSYKLGWFHIDEGDVLHEDEFNILAARLNRTGVRRRQGWITMNPTNPDHWLLKRFTSGDPDYQIIYSNTYQNREYLPSGYIEDLEKLYSPEWVRRYLMGEFVFLAEGEPIYFNFDAKIHDIGKAKYIPNSVVYRGWDFGGRHPAVVFAQKDGNKLTVQHEYMGANIVTSDFAQLVNFLSGQADKGRLSSALQRLVKNTELQPFYPTEARFQDYCDPAGSQIQSQTGKTEIDVLNNADPQIFPQYRKSEIKEGLDIIRFLLSPRKGEPWLKIAGEQVPILRQGFLGGYKCTKRGDAVLEDVPHKDGYHEHLQDALRYIVIHLYEGAFDRPRVSEDKYFIFDAVSGLA